MSLALANNNFHSTGDEFGILLVRKQGENTLALTLFMNEPQVDKVVRRFALR